MMITVAPELKASLRVARAVLASRARPWAGRSALAVALLVIAAPGVVARQQAGTSQASEEVALMSTGWAYLAAGDLARAVDHANLALAKSPRSLAAITLLVHADIMRAGALTGLDSYEQWLGGRAPDDGYLLRHVARASLLEIRRSRRSAFARPGPEASVQGRRRRCPRGAHAAGLQGRHHGTALSRGTGRRRRRAPTDWRAQTIVEEARDHRSTRGQRSRARDPAVARPVGRRETGRSSPRPPMVSASLERKRQLRVSSRS